MHRGAALVVRGLHGPRAHPSHLLGIHTLSTFLSLHCPFARFISAESSLSTCQHTDVSPTCSAAWLSALSSARLLGRTVPTPRLCCTSSPVPLFGVLPGPHSSRTAPSELRVPEPHVYSPSPSHLLSPHSEPTNCPWLLPPSCHPSFSSCSSGHPFAFQLFPFYPVFECGSSSSLHPRFSLFLLLPLCMQLSAFGDVSARTLKFVCLAGAL